MHGEKTLQYLGKEYYLMDIMNQIQLMIDIDVIDA
jgi:hypothetical protein